jgi:hypothetical protein
MFRGLFDKIRAIMNGDQRDIVAKARIICPSGSIKFEIWKQNIEYCIIYTSGSEQFVRLSLDRYEFTSLLAQIQDMQLALQAYESSPEYLAAKAAGNRWPTA